MACVRIGKVASHSAREILITKDARFQGVVVQQFSYLLVQLDPVQ
jgi:5-formaminoimidazole-4-carboxamide-1-beta-D-ribofuranosyl 5'-monophosphate synthetase